MEDGKFLVWTKDCDCRNVTATTNEIRMTQDEKNPYIAIFTYYPMPSCDNCGRAWIVKQPTE